jgi:hypothetical protein
MGFPVDFPLNQSIDIYFYMIRFTDSPVGVFPQEVDARRRAVSAIFAPRKLGQLGEVGRLKKEKLGDPEDWRKHGPIFF